MIFHHEVFVLCHRKTEQRFSSFLYLIPAESVRSAEAEKRQLVFFSGHRFQLLPVFFLSINRKGS